LRSQGTPARKAALSVFAAGTIGTGRRRAFVDVAALVDSVTLETGETLAIVVTVSERSAVGVWVAERVIITVAGVRNSVFVLVVEVVSLRTGIATVRNGVLVVIRVVIVTCADVALICDAIAVLIGGICFDRARVVRDAVFVAFSAANLVAVDPHVHVG